MTDGLDWDRIKADMEAKNAAAEAEARVHGIYHRGWRFYPPYVCSHCGVAVSARQFAFARVCGSCALGRSPHRQLASFLWFLLGRVVDENKADAHRIEPEFVQLETPMLKSSRRRSTPPLKRPNRFLGRT